MCKNNIIKEMNKEKTTLHYKVIQIIHAIKGPGSKEEARKHKHAIRSKVFSEIDKQSEKHTYRDLKLIVFSVAATIAVVFFSINYIFRGQNTKVNTELAQNIEMYSPFGLISRVTLPDGSTVVLNSNSKLNYPVNFSKKTREVTLNGEAYFEIKKDVKRPFIVNANNLNVKVLGTKFNIKTYKDNDQTIVSLVEGSVQAESEKDETKMILEPGDQLSLNRDNGNMSRSKVNVDWYISWTNGHLVYRDHPLEQIFHDLENRFNIHIICSDTKILQDNYHVSFSHGESLEYIMDLLSYKRNWTYTKEDEGRIITINTIN